MNRGHRWFVGLLVCLLGFKGHVDGEGHFTPKRVTCGQKWTRTGEGELRRRDKKIATSEDESMKRHKDRLARLTQTSINEAVGGGWASLRSVQDAGD